MSRCLALLAVGTVLAAPVAAWLMEGHRLISLDAVEALPDSLPRFFRDGAVAIAEASVDPDLHRPRALPQLRDREAPEHYVNLERLGGRRISPTRSEHLELVDWLAAEPGGGRVRGLSSVGTVPYAVIEGLQRLTVAFAEHRRWPDDPHIQAKILVYAGLMAHYAEDLCQPLHTTIHHDGRAEEDGSSPRTGIHRRVDSLPERAGLDRPGIVSGVELRAFEDPFAAVVAELHRSHALVERVYELEEGLGEVGDSSPSAEVAALTAERYAAAVGFVGGLFLTAWEDSADLDLPDWLQR